MADPKRNRQSSGRSPSAPLTGAISVDDDTADALALFNTRLAKQADDDRAAKRVSRATRAKDAAAAHVRDLENDIKATVEQRSHAAAAYREAVAALDRAKRGEPDPPKTQTSEPDAAAAPAEAESAAAEPEPPAAEAEPDPEPAAAEEAARETDG